MADTRMIVNGTLYETAEEDANGVVTLASSKHDKVMVTSLEELATQYGDRQAWTVLMALRSRKPTILLKSRKRP